MAGNEHEHSGEVISRILKETNRETFAAAKDAIMNKVLVATLQEAIDELGSADDIANRALTYVDEQHTALHGAVGALKERLLDDVARRSTETLSDPEAAAGEAHTRIDEENEILGAAQDVLRARLLSDVAERSTQALADPEAAAGDAYTRIEADDPVLFEVTETLKARLLGDVAERSTQALADAQAAALQARTLIDDDHATLVGASDELKQRLIAEIATRSTKALADPEATADKAMALVDTQHTALLEAIDHLKEQLLQTIVRESLSQISHEMGGANGSLPDLHDRAAHPPADSADQPPSEPAASNEPAFPADTAPTAQVHRKIAVNGYPEDEPVFEAKLDPEDEPAMGFYLYGVVENRDTDLADALPKGGIDPEYPPILLPFRSMAAIVSKVPLAPFQEDDAEWKTTVAQAHDRVLGQAAEAGCVVLPSYSGSTYASIGALKETLTEQATAVQTALEELADRREWDVQIYCDPENVKHAVQRANASVDSFKDEFAETTTMWSEEGPNNELAKFEQGSDTTEDEVVETILSSCRERSHRILCDCAVDTRDISLSEDSVFGNNRMVLNASYLVDDDDGTAFRDTLAHLVDEYEDLGLVYYVKGPHMPCRFTVADLPTL